MASALETDPGAGRELRISEPREFSRTAQELTGERVRLTSRIRARLRRCFPQMLELSDNLHEDWLLDLWEIAPIPEKEYRIAQPQIRQILKCNRIRRIDAAGVREILTRPALTLAPGTAEAAARSLFL